MVSFFDVVGVIFAYLMVFYRNIVYKQVLHQHQKIYFFHSFSFHMLSKRNDQRNIFYYMPYKLQQKVLSQIDFSKDKNILCINDWKSSLALFVVIFLRQLLLILKTIEINQIT